MIRSISQFLLAVLVLYGVSIAISNRMGFFGLSARPVIAKLQSGDPLPADLFIKLAQIINPTVVNISTSQLVKQPSITPFNDPFFEFFFSPYIRPPRERALQSLGTGFVIRSNGLIITNTHVVKKADTIEVQLMENSDRYKAKLIGQDMYTDVALLKITSQKKLATVQMGKSSELQVGEWVAAFGNPYSQGHTMTKGIISAINREIDELNLFPFLQTDASINPGNSGGPLVNTAGEVIGINTAMISHGIGFAIPIDNVKVILKDLEHYGRVRRGFIGVQMSENLPSNKRQKGALIVHVIPNMPAEKAGVKKYDIISKFNKKKIHTYKDLFKAVATTPVNTTVPVEIIRNKKLIALSITVRESKKTTQAAVTPSSKNKPAILSALGLSLANGTKELLRSLKLPFIHRVHPVVVKIKSKGLANWAGLQKKDIILKVNGQRVSSVEEVQKIISRNRTNLFNILRYRSQSDQYINLMIRIKIR